MSTFEDVRREARLRADRLKQDVHCEDAPSAKEIVEVWGCVCKDEDRWRGRAEGPIVLLRSRLEYFGAVLLSPAQMHTAAGTANLDIASGKKLEKVLASVHAERLGKI